MAELNPTVDEQAICKLLEGFFAQLTVKEQRLLSLGTPSGATKAKTATLLLDLVLLVSENILQRVDSTQIMAEEVQSSLGDMLPQALTKVLGAEVYVDHSNSAALTDMLTNEVVKRITTSPDSADGEDGSSNEDRGSEPSGSSSSTERDILADMIERVSYMLSEFMSHNKVSLRTSPKWKSELPTNVPEGSSTYQDLPLKTETVKKVPDYWSISTEVVQEIVRKELDEIVTPFFRCMPDAKCKHMLYDSSIETKYIAGDISKVMDRELKCLQESKKKTKLQLGSIASRLKTFLTTQFATASFHHIATELMHWFYSDSMPESNDLIDFLTIDINSFLPEQGQGQGIEATLENCFGTTCKDFANSLCNLLYNYIKNHEETIPEKTFTLPSRKKMYGVIHCKVWRYMRLVAWWLDTQLVTYTNKAVHALISAATVVPTPKGARNEDMKRLSIRILVEKLVTKCFMDSKKNMTAAQPDIFAGSLFDKIWCKVKDEDFEVCLKTSTFFVDTLYTYLCKRWGGIYTLSHLLTNHQTTFDEKVASAFVDHLLGRPKPVSLFHRVLSTVIDAVPALFRCRH